VDKVNDIAPVTAGRVMKEQVVETIEHWLREVKRRGLRVNNLFHLNSGMWRCNVRAADNSHFYEFGNGVDPQHAIEEALARVDAARKVKPTVEHDPERPPTVPSPIDDDDLIG